MSFSRTCESEEGDVSEGAGDCEDDGGSEEEEVSEDEVPTSDGAHTIRCGDMWRIGSSSGEAVESHGQSRSGAPGHVAEDGHYTTCGGISGHGSPERERDGVPGRVR